MARNSSRTTTDHDEIRRWAEERGGSPAEVGTTARGSQTGIIRIDFPGFSGEGKLKRISWDEWFQKFDESNLAFVYQDTTARGQKSNFNKIVARETAAARARGVRTSRRAAGGRSRAGASAGRSRGRSTRTAQRTGRRTQRAGSRRQAGGRKAAPRAEAARTARASTSRRGGASTRGTSGRGRGRAAGTSRRGTASRRGGGTSRKTTGTSRRGGSRSRRGR
ncbi:MAG TPA: hypothetical protein VD838_02230 [Anaeromyxobacteraceae bacterium]|nr:hypothetical protein [Anaeromyxobacteraceae bacterium]